MSGGAFKCGHPRSEENSHVAGITTSCLICRRAMWQRQSDDARERRNSIVADYRGGASIEWLAGRYRVSASHVRKVLNEEGASCRLPFHDDPLYPSRAIKLAAELAGANVKQLLSDWRSPKVLVHARWALAKAMRKRGASTVQIGRRLNRDHSTILYALRQAETHERINPEFAELFAKVDAA